MPEIPPLTANVTGERGTFPAPRVRVTARGPMVAHTFDWWLPGQHLTITHEFHPERPSEPMAWGRGEFAAAARMAWRDAVLDSREAPRGLWVTLEAVDWSAVADATLTLWKRAEQERGSA